MTSGRDHVPTRGLHAPHALAGDADPDDGGLLLDSHAERAGGLGVADGRAVGVDPAVFRAEGAAEDVVEDDVGVDLGDLCRSHPARGDAEALLQGEVLAEDRLLGGVGEEEEVALLAEADVASEALLEGLPDADAVGGEADIRLGGELLADAAGGVGGGAAPDRIALQDDDVGHAALGQRVGDGAAHDPRADDDGLGRWLHPRRSLIAESGNRHSASAPNWSRVWPNACPNDPHPCATQGVPGPVRRERGLMPRRCGEYSAHRGGGESNRTR